MFFVLSKTVDFLAMPLTLVLMSLLGGILVKNQTLKKRLILSAFILLFFFSNDFISNEVMSAWEVKTVPFSSLRPHELAIVLTGSTIPFLKPEDRVYFARGADRVIHTVQLYKLGLIKKILISGGTGRLVAEGEPEADKFKRAMIIMGVPDSVILIENITRNTYESAARVRPMLDSLHLREEDCLLITSAFHMRRSLACYRKVGLNVEPFSTDFYSHPRSFYPSTMIVPSLEALINWHKLVKEWGGFAAYKLAGYI